MKETLELIGAVQDLLDEIKLDSEDGKLTVMELLGNYPQVIKVIDEGGDYEAVVAELKSMTEDELVDLTAQLIKIVYTILAIVKNLKKDV